MVQSLDLNQALFTVNRNVKGRLDVFYQVKECFECPMDKIKTLPSPLELGQFVVATKHTFNLELRNSFKNNNESIRNASCTFNDLSLNNQGQYRINVRDANSSHESLECSIQTIDQGECLLCPIAIILSILFLATIIEKVYKRFTSPESVIPTDKVDIEEAKTGERKEQELSQQVNVEAGSIHEQVSSEPIVTNESNTNANKPLGSRVESLDAFRGLTIAGMIMINYGGAGFYILEHKPWDGITPADFVFPFFIFSTGASIAISTQSMIKRGKAFDEIVLKIVRRSLILMILGLCLNSKALNGDSLNKLRLTGVLQRFSISYLVVALTYTIELTLYNWLQSQAAAKIPFFSRIVSSLPELVVVIKCLTIYIYATFFLQYDTACPMGYTGPGGMTEGGRYANCTGGAAAWIDRLILSEDHLYNDTDIKEIFKTKVTHDPEGILGYSTSILLTIFGLQYGKIVTYYKDHKMRLYLFSECTILLALTCTSVILIPINKRLWSLPFVCLTGTCAFLIMILFYLIIEVLNCEQTFLLRLLISAGKNSIFLYVGHSLINGLLPWYFMVDNSSHLQLLLRLVWSTFLWLLAAHYMASKKLFIKI